MPNTKPLLNVYNRDQCQAICSRSPFIDQIKNDFKYLSWEKYFFSPKNLKHFSQEHGLGWTTAITKNYPEEVTPRERLANASYFSMAPFFYLEKLLEKNPTEIYDLGCGSNIFKKYIPNIVGVSPTAFADGHGDVQASVNHEYVSKHQAFFESVFSINSLHFVPLTDLAKTITDFASMVKPGGRGFLALSLPRMIEYSSASQLAQCVGPTPTSNNYDQYVINTLVGLDINYLILDVNIVSDDKQLIDDPIDGNIRIVFEGT